jgi:DNA-binding NarL/FixJ family response regulator
LALDFSEPLAVVEEPVGLAPAPAQAVEAVTRQQALFRDKLAGWLAADVRLRIVGEAKTWRSAGDTQRSELLADIVLMDLQLAQTTSAQLASDLSSEAPTIRVLVLPDSFKANEGSASDRPESSAPHMTPETLIAQLAQFYGSEPRAGATDRPAVSKRELTVLAEVAAGRSNKQIARRLGISQKTVRNHLSRIFHRLGVSNRTEAVMTAMRHGLMNI